jgi:hypothetical protein
MPGERAAYMSYELFKELHDAGMAYRRVYWDDNRYLILQDADYYMVRMWVNSEFAGLTLKEFICKLCM